MGRPSQSVHPLAKVRKHTSKTQRQFATLVGVSEVTIRKIESGSLALSHGLAQRISVATGVDVESILDMNCVTPRERGTRRPYSDNSFLYWSSTFLNNPIGDEVTIIQHAEVLKELVEELLFASVEQERSFQPVLLALCQAIAEIRERFGLVKTTAQIRSGKRGPKNPEAYETRKSQTFHVRSLGNTTFIDEKAPKLAIPADPMDISSADWAVITAQQTQESRAELLKKVRNLA